MNTTPSKNTSGNTPSRRSSFSPITLPESPVASMKQKGNLTGNARIIRDSCATLCNLSKKWEACNQAGADIIMKIINLKLDAGEKLGLTDEDVLYPNGLEETVTELEKKCDDLVTIVNEMETVKAHLIGIEKLEKLQNKGDLPIFISWPTSKFGQVADHVVGIYRKELKMKLKIKEKIAHQSTRANMMFYFSCWFYEVYIDKNFKEELFNMAMEVGFK